MLEIEALGTGPNEGKEVSEEHLNTKCNFTKNGVQSRYFSPFDSVGKSWKLCFITV